MQVSNSQHWMRLATCTPLEVVPCMINSAHESCDKHQLTPSIRMKRKCSCILLENKIKYNRKELVT